MIGRRKEMLLREKEREKEKRKKNLICFVQRCFDGYLHDRVDYPPFKQMYLSAYFLMQSLHTVRGCRYETKNKLSIRIRRRDVKDYVESSWASNLLWQNGNLATHAFVSDRCRYCEVSSALHARPGRRMFVTSWTHTA
ncbi:unnamed protein product [Musa acuminata var. zebrina]